MLGTRLMLLSGSLLSVNVKITNHSNVLRSQPSIDIASLFSAPH